MSHTSSISRLNLNLEMGVCEERKTKNPQKIPWESRIIATSLPTHGSRSIWNKDMLVGDMCRSVPAPLLTVYNWYLLCLLTCRYFFRPKKTDFMDDGSITTAKVTALVFSVTWHFHDTLISQILQLFQNYEIKVSWKRRQRFAGIKVRWRYISRCQLNYVSQCQAL